MQYLSGSLGPSLKYSNRAIALAIFLFLLLFVSLYGNAFNQSLNQIILWGGGPLLALWVVLPNIPNLSKTPTEHWLYASLLIFAVLGSYQVTDWTGYYRYMQVMVSNLVLILVVFFSLKTWKEVNLVLLSILVTCTCVVVLSFIINNDDSAINDEYYRFSGLAGNANGMANYSRVGILMALFFLCKRQSFFYKLILYLLLLIFSYTILITASRGTFINIVLVFACFWGLMYFKGWKLVILLLALIIFGQYLYTLIETAIADFYLYDRLTRNETADSIAENEARIILYQYAWNAFQNNPFLGVGLNQFKLYSGGKISHTDFLDIAVQLGIFAVIAYATIYVRLFRKMRKLKSVLSNLLGVRYFYMFVIIFFSELLFGFTNPNWFSQLQMLLLAVLITIFHKVLNKEWEVMKYSVSAY